MEVIKQGSVDEYSWWLELHLEQGKTSFSSISSAK